MGVPKFMHAGVVDPCTIREDMSRRMDSNGDGRELGRAWAGLICVYCRFDLS